MSHYLVTITGSDYDAMADLVRKHHVNVLRETAKRLEDKGFRVDAVVDDERLRELETKDYEVEIREDIDEVGRLRQAEIGVGNRYLM